METVVRHPPSNALRNAFEARLCSTSVCTAARAQDPACALQVSAALQGIPDAATLVDLAPDGQPDMATQREEHVRHVTVGTTMLVKPGETVRTHLRHYSAPTCRSPTAACSKHDLAYREQQGC